MYMAASDLTWAPASSKRFLDPSGSIWILLGSHLEASGGICNDLGTCGFIWQLLGSSVNIPTSLEASEIIWKHLDATSIHYLETASLWAHSQLS